MAEEKTSLEKKLELIQRVKDFARSELNLNFSDNLLSKLEEECDTYYYLYASYSEKIESIETVNGYPFKLFGTNKENAEQEAQRLCDNGYDVIIYRAIATAASNITKRLLENNEERIAEVVIHESMHNHLYNNKLQLPYCLEESFCTAIGLNGAMLFFEYNNDPDNMLNSEKEIKKKLDEYKKIIKKYHELEELLSGKYDTKLFFEECKNVFKEFENVLYVENINNAWFLMMSNYALYYPLMDKLIVYMGNPRSTIDFLCRLPNNLEEALKEIKSEIKKWKKLGKS